MMGGHSVHLQEESGLPQDQRQVTIDVLPDDVLGEIFYFYEDVGNPPLWDTGSRRNTWHALVHVCRRWRYLVFASPRRLNLRLTYSGHRPISEALDAWPVLPVSVISRPDQRWDHTVAALESEHSNRICEIHILMVHSRWESFAVAMQKPFPELTHLEFWTYVHVPVLPEWFLGGSAPRLRSLRCASTPFQSFPKLLLSANGLVELSLLDIPDSRYFSPDVMATALAVMTSLEIFWLGFRYPPDLESRPLPPPTRIVLPAITKLVFKGTCQYLEDLLARIDAPRLLHLNIVFFMDLAFDLPQLHRLIGHAEEFKAFDHGEVSISNRSIRLSLYPKACAVDRHRQYVPPVSHHKLLVVEINCIDLGRQLSSLTQVCRTFPLISALVELQIREDHFLLPSHWKVDTKNAQWLEILDPFTALQNLYLINRTAHRLCGALRELSRERATEVLPALRNLFLCRQGPALERVQKAMISFVTARQLSGHPVVIDHWKFQPHLWE